MDRRRFLQTRRRCRGGARDDRSRGVQLLVETRRPGADDDIGVYPTSTTSRSGRVVHRSATARGRGVRARARRQRRVRRRRAHASRDARRAVDQERARDGAARARHGRRLRRAEPARVREPSRVSARPLPRERHDGRDALRRAELGAGRRAGSVPGPARHPAARRAADPRRRAPRARAQRDRAELRGSQRAARRDGGHRPDRQGRRVQGLHGVGPERAGLLARGPRDRPAGDPEGARSRREDLRRAQGPAARELRRGAQPSRRHRRGLAPVPRHAVRRVPRRVGQEPRRGPVRPQRDASASTRSCARSTSTASRRTATCGSTSAPCGGRCCGTRPRPRTRSASC